MAKAKVKYKISGGIVVRRDDSVDYNFNGYVWAFSEKQAKALLERRHKIFIRGDYSIEVLSKEVVPIESV